MTPHIFKGINGGDVTIILERIVFWEQLRKETGETQTDIYIGGDLSVSVRESPEEVLKVITALNAGMR